MTESFDDPTGALEGYYVVDFEPLLLEIMIILLPIFFYQYILDRTPFYLRARPQSLIGWLSVAATLLCMYFPFAMTTDFLYDFRAIPLLLSILYGGRRVGIVGAFLMFAYRYHIGGQGFYVSIICLGPIVLAALAITRRYDAYSPLQRMKVAFWLVVFANGMRSVATYAMDRSMSHYIAFSVAFFVIGVVTMVLVMYLIENISQTVKMRLEMARSEKLQVVSDLAASIAHEIRNPMTTVRGFAQLLIRDESLTDKQHAYLDTMVSELDRAQGIITDYLSFAKPQAESTDTIDVAEQLSMVVKLLFPYALSHGVELCDETEMKGLYVQGNAAKLRQALVNVIKNGIESVKDSGTVWVKAYIASGEIAVKVTDSGIGMTKAELARLGSPFYSTKSNGTGLGLMVTYQIIDKMGGNINVTSDKGCGTTFSILLPVRMPSTREVAAAMSKGT